VEPGEGALDDPAVAAETGAVFGVAPGDDRSDAAGAQRLPVLLGVVATIGELRSIDGKYNSGQVTFREAA
jgi:hypothetical protein